MSEAKNFIRKSAFVQYSTDDSIQNHFKQHHPITHTQSTIHPYGWSLINENFHSSQHSPQPFILRGAEGEVAESIIPEITLVLRDSGVLLRRWLRFGEEPLFNIPHPSWHGPLIAREKVFLRFLKQWILQLRARPSCRMTWGCGERLEEEISFFKCTVTNGRKWTAPVLYQTHASIKKECT